MVLFLKLISVAVCYQDYRVKKREVINAEQQHVNSKTQQVIKGEMCGATA